MVVSTRSHRPEDLQQIFYALHEELEKSDEASLERVQSLVQMYPDVTQHIRRAPFMSPVEFEIPLHTAIMWLCSADIILFLAERTPSMNNGASWCPSPLRLLLECFHHQAGPHPSLRVLRMLTRRFRKDLMTPTHDWRHPTRLDLPIHFALRGRLPSDVIKILAKAEPSALNKENGIGQRPLLVACCRRFVDDAKMLQDLQLLVQYCPEVMELGDDYLHKCLVTLMQDCEGGPLAVRFLLEHLYPSLCEKFIPFEATKCKTQTYGFVYCLARLFPETLGVVHNGSTALHEFCDNENVVRGRDNLLLFAQPEAVRVKDRRGRLPLHLLCQQNPELQLVQAFVKLYPESVRIADKRGLLPLHFACMQHPTNKADAIKQSKLIRYLVEQHPAAIDVPANNHWNKHRPELRLPAFLAASNRNAQLDAVYHLLRLHPGAVLAAQRPGRPPSGRKRKAPEYLCF